MSNFNPLNLNHVMTLALIAAEVELFGKPSAKSKAAALQEGLVPTDMLQLQATLDNIKGLQKLLNEQGERFGNDTGFLKAVEQGEQIALTILTIHETVAVAKEKGLLVANSDGVPVYDEALSVKDGEAYKNLMADTFKRVEQHIAQNNNEDNEEVEHEGAESSEQAGGVAVAGEEQAEDHDQGRDVPVSTPVAA